MPEGQFTGDRATYNYTMDNGTEIQLVLDSTLASVTNTGLTLASSGDGSISKPTRFEPRGVFWQGELGGKVKRKFIVCDNDSTLFASNTAQEITIDGVAGQTTGRKGEKISFPKLTGITV